MNESNVNGLHKLFELKENEKILDDFGCSYSDKMIYHGRMFLTENYICFNSSLFAIVKKLKLRIKNIKSINKKKNLLSDNAIEIIYQTIEDSKRKEKKCVFTSFSNRDGVLSRITDIAKLNKKSNSVARGIYSSDEDQEADTRTMMTSNSLAVLMEESASSERLQKQESDEKDIDIEETLTKYSKEWTEFPKYMVDCSIEQFYESFLKDDAEYGFGAFCQSKSRAEIEITKWMKHDRDPDFGDDLMTTVKEICASPVSEVIDEVPVNPNNTELQVFLRFSRFRDKVKGIPFVDTTRVHKHQKIIRKGNIIIYSTTTRSMDTPYADYFFVNDIYEVVSYQGKCLVRSFINTNFVKSTYFKSTIETRIKEEFPKEVSSVKDYVGQKYAISLYAPQKQVTQLQHGLIRDSERTEISAPLRKLTFKERIIDLTYFLYSRTTELKPMELLQIVVWLLILFYLILINSKLSRFADLNFQVLY